MLKIGKVRTRLGCSFCAARGLFGMEVDCVVTRAGVQKRIGVDVAIWPVLVADGLVDARRGYRWPAGQRVRDPIWRGCSNGLCRSPRRSRAANIPTLPTSALTVVYAYDRSCRERDSDLGVDCSAPAPSAANFTFSLPYSPFLYVKQGKSRAAVVMPCELAHIY